MQFHSSPRIAFVSVALLAFVSGCAMDVDRDEDEPIDDRSNEIHQGVYSCTESSATGYRNGNSFPIKVVKADNKPVQLDTANAYIAMQKKAKDSAGVSIRVVSGFRSNSEQEYLYGCYVNCNCNNCNLAARPGYSNHQSGHALDLNTSDPGVLSWLNAHGDEYGFARTVPSEPWHWEYWGAVDFDGPCGGPPLPQECVSGNFDGEFCDDDGNGAEDAHDYLKNELGVDFHCANISGEPAYCGNKDVTRAQSISVLGRAAKMPTNGHPNAFSDDNGHANEKSMNAAKAFGIFLGSNGKGNPDGKATRSTLAVMMKRMYLLPPADRDYFDDDDDSGNEDAHNRAAAAGLFGGYSDNNGGRKDFRGSSKGNRSTLAILAKRAAEKGLVPVWDIPQQCIDGTFTGAFCDDDGTGGSEAIERLISEANLPGMYCRDLAGSPAFCADKEASRAMSLLILTGSAGIPLEGHPDAFNDDNDHPRERYFDAAKAFGIVGGYDGGTKMKPSNIANRDTLAVILSRMYGLQEDGVDYFTDDDGDASEHWHNKVGAAGLFTGYSDGNGGRQFRGDKPATKGMLATLALRAKEAQLVPVWAPVAPPPDDAGGPPEEDPAVDDLAVDNEDVDDQGNAVQPTEDEVAASEDDPLGGQPMPDEEDPNLVQEGALEGPPEGLEPFIAPKPSVQGNCNSAGAGSLITIFTLLPLLALIAARRRGLR